MTYRLIISPRASVVLDEIAEWCLTTSDDADVADCWLFGFRPALESLKTEPDRFPLAYEAVDLGIELRELHYGSGRRRTHRAMFRNTGNVVEVLAIRHSAQRDVTTRDLGIE